MQPLSGDLASVTGCPEYDYAIGQPNLYRMMRLKQDLVVRHGLVQGFEMFKRTFRFATNAALSEVRIESERTFAAQKALLYTETAAAGEQFRHEPPHVVGDGNHRAIHGVTRSQYVACLSDVWIRGRSSLMIADGHWLLDVQDGEGERLDDELEWDPVVFHDASPVVWGIVLADKDQAIEVDEGFTLLGAHTDFFGHWMAEYLPKYVAARLSGLLPDVPVIIDGHMPPSHRQSLERLYRPPAIIDVPFFRPVHVQRLWCAPTISYFPLHEVRNKRFNWDVVSACPARFDPVVKDLQRRLDSLDAAPVQGARLYLARRGFRHRRLTNSEEIEAAAQAAGFAIVYPEDLSFVQQACLLRCARTVIAPEGSAIFLAMFARPDTALLILSHPLTDVLADYNGLFRTHGVRMLTLTGPITRTNRETPHDSDYSIDVKTFARVARGLGSES